MFLFLGIVIDAIRAGRRKGENRLRGKAKSGKNVRAQEKEWNLGYLFSFFSFLPADYGYEQLFFFQNGRLVRRFCRPCTLQTRPKEMLVCKYANRKEESRDNDDAVVSNIFAEITIQMKAPVLSCVIFDSYPRFFVRRETRLRTRAFKMAESLVGKAAQVHSYRNVQQIHIEHVDLRIGISENAKRLVIRFSDV